MALAQPLDQQEGLARVVLSILAAKAEMQRPQRQVIKLPRAVVARLAQMVMVGMVQTVYQGLLTVQQVVMETLVLEVVEG